MNTATSDAIPAPIRLNDLWVMPAYERLLRENRLDSIDALFARDGEQTLAKPGLAAWRTRLRLGITDGADKRVWYMKRYERPPAGAARTVRRADNGATSVAGVEWNWIRVLANLGIPCVEAIAFGEQMASQRETRSVLVTDEVPGDALERLLPHGTGPPPENIVRRLADVAAGLHRAGLVHRDFYLAHVFAEMDDDSGASVRLIDLQRVLRPRWNVARWYVKDLAALNYSAPGNTVSSTTRVRFILRYLSKARLDHEARRLIYRIIGKTQQIARHDARRAIGSRA